MAFQVRQGTNAQRLTIIPQSGELIYTTDTKEIYVGDGVTVGGVQVSGGGGNSTYGNTNVFDYLGSGSNVNLITTGNVVAATISTGGSNGNITGVNYYFGNVAQISGNVSAAYFIGDGSLLSNVGNVGNYGNANVAAFLPTYTGKLGNSVTIAIGSGAGQTNQDLYTVAVGDLAGQTNQGEGAVAVGSESGLSNQGDTAVAVGPNAGQSNQGASAVAVGNSAGRLNQGVAAVSVGISSGGNSQGFAGVAVGAFAASLNQGANAIAIGTYAAQTNQAANSIAIGTQAWANGMSSIAIGPEAGFSNPGSNTISIGAEAGSGITGNNSICIGSLAGSGIVGANTIVIAATQRLASADGPGFYVEPVREDNGNTAAAVFYNSDTAEFTWSKSSTTLKTPVQVATTVSLSTLSQNGYIYNNGPGNDGQNAYIQQFDSPSGTYDPLVIDGVTMVAGYRVLVKDEIGSTGVNPGLLTGKNGIYVVTQPGDLTTRWKLVRADDFNTANEVPDATVFVEMGTVNKGTEWRCTTLKYDPFVMGSTSANFTDVMRQLPQTKASNATGVPGDICWDANYIYVCTAPNTWKRASLSGGY